MRTVIYTDDAGIERLLKMLGRREREVARLVEFGLLNKEIAHELGLSERTIKGHIARLFAELNLRNRSKLSRWVRAHPQALVGDAFSSVWLDEPL